MIELIIDLIGVEERYGKLRRNREHVISIDDSLASSRIVLLCGICNAGKESREKL